MQEIDLPFGDIGAGDDLVCDRVTGHHAEPDALQPTLAGGADGAESVFTRPADAAGGGSDSFCATHQWWDTFDMLTHSPLYEIEFVEQAISPQNGNPDNVSKA